MREREKVYESPATRMQGSVVWPRVSGTKESRSKFTLYTMRSEWEEGEEGAVGQRREEGLGREGELLEPKPGFYCVAIVSDRP